MQSPRRIALCVEYNGSAFSGWQAQKSTTLRTVQEELESALSSVANHAVPLFCAGRTDRGVHACAQVVHFDSAHERPDKAWVQGTNSLVSPHVSVLWARPVAPDFHARFSAHSRRYLYVIDNTSVRPAILQGLVSHHRVALDAGLMHEAAQLLLGEHDFSAFRGAGCQSRTPMRNVTEITVRRRGRFVTIDVAANAFLLHMVRNIAGSLLEVGEGLRPPQWIGELLAMRDRRNAGVTAPPDGLYLTAVEYPGRFGLPVADNGPPFLVG